MSLGKKSEKFNELVEFLKQAQEDIRKNFYKAYGCYHNVSETLYLEVMGSEQPDKIVWREGNLEQGTEEINEILEIDKAVVRLMEMCNKGFQPYIIKKFPPPNIPAELIPPDFDFSALTEKMLEEEKQKLAATYSELKRDKKLGTYRKNNSWVRIKEYTDNEFTVERGYELALTSMKNYSLSETKEIIESILAKGFIKEGDKITKQKSSVSGNFDPAWFKL